MDVREVRFVGRASELERLRSLIGEARGGAGRVAVIEGEAGSARAAW